ncbi:type II secretion system protein J [Pseudomonas putida]|nr:type II secretion system protein J [Pseudomonas putida]
MPAKQATRCMAPALPVFAGMPAPTGPALAWRCPRTCRSNFLSQNLKSLRDSTCGSGQAREASDAVYGTGFAGVRGHARSHRACAGLELPPYLQEQLCCSKFEKPARFIVGAGKPAKQATRCMAPAAPVFAGTPAPTGTAYKPPPDPVSGFAETRECARQLRCTRPAVQPRPCGHARPPGSHHPLPAKGKTPAPPSHAGLRTGHA